MKRKKLSKTQQEIVDLMRSGWELSASMTFDRRTHLQKGGTGRGGEMKGVSGATLHALWKAGVIKVRTTGFPFEIFELRKDFK